MSRKKYPLPPVHGSVAPGLEEVRSAFEDNFTLRGDLGAAVAIYHRGKRVVHLWGGYGDAQKSLPWREDTLVTVFSVTKGMVALAVALAHSRGWLDYDREVAAYWPAFAENGKDRITVRQLLSHQAGLALIGEPLTLENLADPDHVARVLARQQPGWAPGTRHGYHCYSLGWYAGELLRRVDPRHRTAGAFIRDELARPLGMDFHLGLPPGFPEERIANIVDFFHHPVTLARQCLAMPRPLLKAILNPLSLSYRVILANPGFLKTHEAFNKKAHRAVEIPAANGMGSANAVARAYSEFATGGKTLGIAPGTLAELARPPTCPLAGAWDDVLKMEAAYSLGFLKPHPAFPFGRDDSAFGCPGAGGSFGFADPAEQVGFGYVLNKVSALSWNDPRERALHAAFYRALGHLPC